MNAGTALSQELLERNWMLPALITVRPALDAVAESPVWAGVLTAVNDSTAMLRANVSGALHEQAVAKPAPRPGKQMPTARLYPGWYSMVVIRWLPRWSHTVWAGAGDPVWQDIHTVVWPLYGAANTAIREEVRR